MTAGNKLVTTNEAAADGLLQLLHRNLVNTPWNNYTLGHQERMTIINKVLQSDGGKTTVETLIKMMETSLQTLNLQATEEKARYKAECKKHPFKDFFSVTYYRNQRKSFNNTTILISNLSTIKTELVAAISLVNVIELSGLSNKPKVG